MSTHSSPNPDNVDPDASHSPPPDTPLFNTLGLEFDDTYSNSPYSQSPSSFDPYSAGNNLFAEFDMYDFDSSSYGAPFSTSTSDWETSSPASDRLPLAHDPYTPSVTSFAGAEPDGQSRLWNSRPVTGTGTMPFPMSFPDLTDAPFPMDDWAMPTKAPTQHRMGSPAIVVSPPLQSSPLPFAQEGVFASESRVESPPSTFAAPIHSSQTPPPWMINDWSFPSTTEDRRTLHSSQPSPTPHHPLPTSRRRHRVSLSSPYSRSPPSTSVSLLGLPSSAPAHPSPLARGFSSRSEQPASGEDTSMLSGAEPDLQSAAAEPAESTPNTSRKRRKSNPSAPSAAQDNEPTQARSTLQPPKLAPSTWQVFFQDWISRNQDTEGGPKLNVAQAAKEAGAEYARMTEDQKEPYKQRSVVLKEIRAREHAAWLRTLSPEEIIRENEQRTAARKAGRSRKANLRDPRAPRKPLSAYFMFLQRIRADPAMVAEVFGDEQETTRQSVLAANKWRSMTDEEKRPFLAQAEQDKLEYDAARKRYEGISSSNEAAVQSGFAVLGPADLAILSAPRRPTVKHEDIDGDFDVAHVTGPVRTRGR